MSQIRDSQLLQKIAVVLKELREKHALTQEDVFGDTQIHIGRIETARANVTVSTLSRLCHYFDISLAEFFNKVEKLGGKR
ncbi:helix-turn-helix transcriptional regulator [Flavihumibacter sp. CACIAM 22H1]|uniref:helix-turn-helix domain-containing protein n=1 Tax=Flavihumibacter sp. CACIAM 22H1 TaxID=1812911 RepID=UPI0007A92A09|nr:helix-turn-helix transcriptional regulator [Flavihumibacter sp. CACIAM 22H1]KYP15223.1 MAG: hypothetical protein A1D16_03165 [Flavihumibacter sp. CACIAM 22H1]